MATQDATALARLKYRYAVEFDNVPRFISTAHRELWLEQRDELAAEIARIEQK